MYINQYIWILYTLPGAATSKWVKALTLFYTSKRGCDMYGLGSHPTPDSSYICPPLHRAFVLMNIGLEPMECSENPPVTEDQTGLAVLVLVVAQLQLVQSLVLTFAKKTYLNWSRLLLN
jgi:hypothetical protein